MASPQIENGYIKIANELFKAIAGMRFPGEQRQCLDVIMIKTYGFNKKRDAISLSQFVGITGIKKPHVIRAINGLLSKKVISVTKKGNSSTHIYEINKDFDKWQSLPKKVTLPKKVISVTKKGNSSLPKKVPTKDNTTKDTITKNNKAPLVPDWIQLDVWNDFKEHRKKLRKPMTPKAEQLIFDKLKKFKKQGYNPNEILEISIERGWQGVFEPKDLPQNKDPTCLECKKKPRMKNGYCLECHKSLYGY